MMNSFLFIQMLFSSCEYVTYFELAGRVHKAVKALYLEYMLFLLTKLS